MTDRIEIDTANPRPMINPRSRRMRIFFSVAVPAIISF